MRLNRSFVPSRNGSLEADNFDGAAARASHLGAEVVLPVYRNPPEGRGGPPHRELWSKDPE
jgi:hypothetical protein